MQKSGSGTSIGVEWTASRSSRGPTGTMRRPWRTSPTGGWRGGCTAQARASLDEHAHWMGVHVNWRKGVLTGCSATTPFGLSFPQHLWRSDLIFDTLAVDLFVVATSLYLELIFESLQGPARVYAEVAISLRLNTTPPPRARVPRSPSVLPCSLICPATWGTLSQF